MEETELQISDSRFIPTVDIMPDPENPKKHSNEDIEAVVKSWKKYGQTTVLMVRKDEDNEGKYIIVAGHKRHEAAKRLMEDVLEVKVMEGTPAEIKAYQLIDNKLGETSDYDNDLLKAMVFDVMDEDDELDELMKSVGLDSLFDDDDFEEKVIDVADDEPEEEQEEEVEDEDPQDDMTDIHINCPHCKELISVKEVLKAEQDAKKQDVPEEASGFGSRRANP